ncbi:MAG TPA: sugar phosphate isomerase/epimerase [Sedimentisphaerales bacterium]|nr:sugar phosphate isomerase/epimerase [Sedimentisphaerales bacterium]
MQEERTRRQFLKAAGAGAAAALASAGRGYGADKLSADNRAEGGKNPQPRAFQLGLASYTLRKFSLEKTLAITQRLGLRYICLKSVHLPLDSSDEQIDETASKVKQAQLHLYGAGVIYMKNEGEVNRAFDYAKRGGMTTIIGVPNPELLTLVDKKVREYDIKVAIHNHGPGDKLYPTPGVAYGKIQQLDNRIGLCIDIGHTQRAGVDPSEAAEKFGDRLLDVHIKDVSAAAAEGHTVEIGRGVIDVPKFITTLLKIKFSGIVSFEHEKDAEDPVAGLAESVGYVRGVLAAV